VILVLNPAQLLQQGRDSNRVSDMATLNTTLGIYSAQGGASLGSSNVVYVSIPDPVATSTAGDNCQGLGLPTLPAIYSYSCAASSTYRLVNGTGWIPVNFSSIAGGSPLGQLPVDPVNTSSSRNYYTYTTNGSQFEVTSVMESQKYGLGGSNDVITGDGGTLASVYEKGTKTGLEPLDYGDNSLVGYWTFDEGTSNIAYDYSGSNATGTWSGTLGSQWSTNAKVGAYAGHFGSAYLGLGNPTQLQITGAISVATWINESAGNPNYARVVTNYEGGSANIGPFQIYINAGNSGSVSCSPSTGGATSIAGILAQGSWYLIGCVYNGSSVSLYINGVLTTSTAASGNLSYSNGFPWLIGADSRVSSSTGDYFAGLIDDVRIYNRALSAAEISAMYNGGK
jgi:hypothetical protein